MLLAAAALELDPVDGRMMGARQLLDAAKRESSTLVSPCRGQAKQ